MKKISTTIAMMAFFALAISFTACKSKVSDGDIKTNVETALKADPMGGNIMVAVDKGVVTISGESKDDASKTHFGEIAKGVKGVKEVINNCTVTPPVVNSTDDVLSRGLADALKDNPGVTGSVEMGKIVLKGEIAKAKWMSLKQMLDKLTPKGYDLDGLTIK
ncbi:MAG: BON domain-containing protein [Chitinophagaceae bacterium]